MSISEQLKTIKNKITDLEIKYQRESGRVQLIAVSKTHPSSAVLEAFEAGQLDFGENKVQELCQKAVELPKEIRWHLIGHLQTNKVKQLLPYVYMIHSVDSLKLIQEIQKQAKKIDKKVNILLQINISNEYQKSGMSILEAEQVIEMKNNFPNIEIKGFMGIAEDTNDLEILKSQFSILTSLNVKYQEFTELSMGMSGDFEEAICCGSTMIRIGSAIFGNRNYL